jgi:methyl-accepting chemotaxis protein
MQLVGSETLKSIRTTIALILGGVVLLIQAGLIYFVASSVYTQSIVAKRHEIALVVDTISKSAADFGSQQMERVRGISKVPVFHEYLSTGKNEAAASEIAKAMSLASADVNSVYLFDAQGKQLITMVQGNSSKHSDLSSRDYVKAALAGKEGFGRAPTKSPATGKLIVSVTAPIVDESGKVIGGVGMSYVLDKLIADYIESTKMGESGHPFILSSTGVIVAHPKRDLLLKDVSEEPGVKAVLSSPKGEGSWVREGKDVKLAWTRVPGWDWVLVFSMDTAEIEALAKGERNFMVLAGSLAILGILAVSLLVMDKIVVRPMRQLEEFASGVAAGDLDKTLDLRHVNEIGKLGDSLRSMVLSLKAKIADANQKTAEAAEHARLGELATKEANAARAAAEHAKAEGMVLAATQLEKVAEIIGQASEEISAQVDESSRGTEVQSQRVAETATAMEEMNATVLEVAKSAAQAADSAANARAKAADGAKIVGQVVQGIESVQNASIAMKDDMGVLGKQVEGIGQIMDVISDIADQTNLLALNAAIEAARAGDAGRGFAVVADEVRKLAEKTMTATQEVGEAISGIQRGTRKNLENVEHAVVTIGQATSLASKSGEELQEIVRLVEISTDQVRSIATASEQQSAASEEINHSIEDIRHISSKTADAMHQSAQAIGELAQQTQSLRTLIENMKSGG